MRCVSVSRASETVSDSWEESEPPVPIEAAERYAGFKRTGGFSRYGTGKLRLECVDYIPNGGTGNNAYTSDCASSKVAFDADCTLTCSAPGYSGTSRIRCAGLRQATPAGKFAAVVPPTCVAN